MPATRARSKLKGKRPRASSAGDAEHLEKRPRSSSGGSPVRDNPNDIHVLRDRARFSWQSKGKWKERTPRRDMMVSLTQAASDLLAPSTSKQGAATNALLAAVEDTSVIDISSILDSPPSKAVVEASPKTPTVNQKELELQAEIDKLRNELKKKDQVISRHENTLEVVQNSMHCPICLDPLWKPFVVVPCGHIACQSCLVNWFTSPPPDPNGNAPAPLPPHRQKQKRKTCPHCRGVVRSRPVEVYGLGSVVATVVGQPGPPSPSKSEAADPWQDMFPLRGSGPVRDDEDHVLRCPECLHELWDGECTRCGRVFSDGGSGDSAFGSDDGSVSIYGDDLGSIFGGGGSLFGGSMYGDSDDGSGDSVYEEEPPLAYIHRGRVYDSYDEDEDEDDSFIDDTELPRPPPAAYFHHYVPSDSEDEEEEDHTYHSARGDGYRSPPPNVIRVSESDSENDSDDEDSGDEEEDDFLPPRGRRGPSAETSSITVPETAEEADDEEDDDDGDDVPSTIDPNATIDLVSDDDDDDDEPPIRAVGRRSAAARWGWSPEDGEPPRGRSMSRRRVVSPRAESENGSEYFSD